MFAHIDVFSSYILNTHFAKAHGASAVTSMIFREPSAALGASGSTTTKKPEMILLTTAEDGSAKVWTIKRGVSDTLQSGPGKPLLLSFLFCLPAPCQRHAENVSYDEQPITLNSNFFPEPFRGCVDF